MHQFPPDSGAQHSLADLLNTAMHCYRQGNLPQTELLSRHILKCYGDHPLANTLLGMIALNIELPGLAADYFKKAVQSDPGNQDMKNNLKLAKNRHEEQKKNFAESGRLDSSTLHEVKDRFLLIKSWGFGFWADMDNVLGQQLLAEITGRVPVVHWGDNSLFREVGCDNAWELYFEPVSSGSIGDVLEKSSSCYPPKWNKDNLLANDNNKWNGPWSRVAGMYLLNREEAVVVNDFHTYVKDLVPWIDKDHPLHGLEPQDVYRVLFSKYIRLKPDIELEIKQFREEYLEGCNVLAVHVRGSDKQIESKELWHINNTYQQTISDYLVSRPGSRIFLLTDSQRVLNEYREKYARQLVYTDCHRTEDNTGVHMQKHSSRKSIGIEVIKDAWLAAGCDDFLGCGHSNVSTAILHMKNWNESEYTLIGENRLYDTNFLLHKR